VETTRGFSLCNPMKAAKLFAAQIFKWALCRTLSIPAVENRALFYVTKARRARNVASVATSRRCSSAPTYLIWEPLVHTEEQGINFTVQFTVDHATISRFKIK
jgi:hypothetical protein